jgi:Thioredoxin
MATDVRRTPTGIRRPWGGPAASGQAPADEARGADASLGTKPKLIFFYSATSGPCRRVEGFLAQVLQRRRNHTSFDLFRVPVEDRPELATRFGVGQLPTILVVADRKIQRRIVSPDGAHALAKELSPWLR